MLSIKTPEEVSLELANRLRERRLDFGWGRDELSERSGVTSASIKRFELSGDISLKRLLALCFVLNALDDFEHVLKSPYVKSVAEIEQEISIRKRQRGRRRKK